MTQGQLNINELLLNIHNAIDKELPKEQRPMAHGIATVVVGIAQDIKRIADAIELRPTDESNDSVRDVRFGARNHALFEMAVFLKKTAGQDWQSLLDGHNQAHLKPPLPQSEVDAIIKGLEKKT